jgi:hypothetical protein
LARVRIGPVFPSTELLPIRWIEGNAPELPVDYSKQIDRATTLSGAARFNYRQRHPRRWQFSWEALRDGQLAELMTLVGYNQPLWIRNEWDDLIVRRAYITEFEYTPMVRLGQCPGADAGPYYSVPFYGDPYYGGWYTGAPLFSAALTLEEMV